MVVKVKIISLLLLGKIIKVQCILHTREPGLQRDGLKNSWNNPYTNMVRAVCYCGSCSKMGQEMEHEENPVTIVQTWQSKL